MLCLKIISLLTSLVLVNGHGYMISPLARQRRCYDAQDYFWPDDGANIVNKGCRKAFQHVYTRNNDSSAAAQNMFTQNIEYAAMAGNDFRNITHIQQDVVPRILCGAGANNASKQFGDKSGMDVASDGWFKNELNAPGANTLYFCPTVLHEPSYFEVYVSKNEYDASKTSLKWSDLSLVYRNVSSIVEKNIDGCHSAQVYELKDVNVPSRNEPFVLYVRWQREDTAGEGFYNCVDVAYKNVHEEL